tara:strand:+ start:10566 stop:10982 length:417 start_codon:yes stop_codon:yes gene_type:complete
MMLIFSDMALAGSILLGLSLPALIGGAYLANRLANSWRRKRLSEVLANPEAYIIARFNDTDTGEEIILTNDEYFRGEKEHQEFLNDPYKLMSVQLRNGTMHLRIRYSGGNTYMLAEEIHYPPEIEDALRKWIGERDFS